MLPTYSSSSSRSDRLGHPWYHQNRARTSLGQNPKIPGSIQINLLFTILQNRHKRRCVVQTFISSEDNGASTANEAKLRKARGRRRSRVFAKQNTLEGGPSGAQISQRATASGPNMVELNGIEPLTPCLQSRCSPS